MRARTRKILLSLGGLGLVAAWYERSGAPEEHVGTASPPVASAPRPQDAIARPRVYRQELSFERVGRDGCRSHWSTRSPLPEHIAGRIVVGKLTGRCYVISASASR